MIPPSTTITDRGRRIRRALMWTAVGIVGLNVAVVVTEALTSSGRVAGPAGSSYVTTVDGAAALAGTLERLDVAVQRSRAPLGDGGLAPDATLVAVEVADAAYTPDEITVLDRFVRSGGRLVVAGRTDLVATLLPAPAEWQSAGADSARFDQVDTEVEVVALSGFGSLVPGDADRPLLVGGDETIAVSRPLGDGTVVWVADSAPFLNGTIGRADTAAAVVAMLGTDRTIVFDEFRHGYSDEGGLWQIIPPSWRVALVLGAVAALAALTAYGRRFGPPQDEHRRLRPSRSAYLEAVGGMMARGNAVDDALDVIRSEARRLLEQRAGPGEDLEAVARHSGLDEDAIGAILGDADDEATLVSADAALATLNEETR